MVRLKEAASGRNLKGIPSFQFQYGSIKRHSTDSKWLIAIWFQFQYGSIKRAVRPEFVHPIYKFQFQYGSIKRKLALWENGDVMMFQFQYGSIKSPCNNSHEPTCNGVSIPIWFD